MIKIIGEVTTQELLQVYREDYDKLSREFQAYREQKEAEVLQLVQSRDEWIEEYKKMVAENEVRYIRLTEQLERASNLIDQMVSQQRKSFLDRL